MTELLGMAAGAWAGERGCQEPGVSGTRVRMVVDGQLAGRLRGRVQCPPEGGVLLDGHDGVEWHW